MIDAVESGRWIFLCEGEKDADNLRKLGFCATTMTDGANKWKPEYTATLERGNVCILPDKDEKGQGQQHAAMVANLLYGRVSNLRVLYLPNMPTGKNKDITDWIEAGGTTEQFRKLVLDSEEYAPEKPDTPRTKAPGQDVQQDAIL